MSSAGARLERLPLSGFHAKLLLIGGAGYAFDGLDSAIIAFILPTLGGLWSIGGAQLGFIGSATYIGFFFGALAAGTIGDRLGRRIVMMWALALFCVASMLSALMTSYPAFLLCRIVAGIGTGAESAIIAPYLTEFVSARYRGAFTATLSGFFSFGFLAAALMGNFLVPMGHDGWRWAVGLTGAPVLLLLWWRRALPESPRWLESAGHWQAAAEVVDVIERRLRDRGYNLPPVIQASRPPMPDILSIRQRFAALCSPLHRRSLAVSWIAWFCLTFSYYAVFTWMPSFLMARGMTMTHSFSFSIAIYAAQIPGYFSAAAAVELIGRRTTIAVYLLGSVLAAGLLVISHSDGSVVRAAMLLSLFLNGAYAGLYAYTPELFPTTLRATGNGAASAVGRIGAIVSPVLVGALMPIVGFAGVFALITAVLLVGSTTVLFFGPRTEGLALEALSSQTESP